MYKTTVEKFHSGGRDFIIIVWEMNNTLLHEEIFEVTKLSERDISGVSVNIVLSEAKGNIDIAISAKSI